MIVTFFEEQSAVILSRLIHFHDIQLLHHTNYRLKFMKLVDKKHIWYLLLNKTFHYFITFTTNQIMIAILNKGYSFYYNPKNINCFFFYLFLYPVSNIHKWQKRYKAINHNQSMMINNWKWLHSLSSFVLNLSEATKVIISILFIMPYYYYCIRPTYPNEKEFTLNLKFRYFTLSITAIL